MTESGDIEDGEEETGSEPGAPEASEQALPDQILEDTLNALDEDDAMPGDVLERIQKVAEAGNFEDEDEIEHAILGEQGDKDEDR